jgi:hypothetical protein
MNIDKMIELRKAATEGPWSVENQNRLNDIEAPDGFNVCCYVDDNDAPFIAACGNFDWEAVRDVVAAASNDILMELDLLISRYKQIAQHPSSNEDDRQGALSAIKEVQNKLDRLSSALARLEGEA